MKVISVMKMRKSFGAILDEVKIKSETFILERAGKPIAKLSPISSDDVSVRSDLQLKSLKDLKNLNPGTQRGMNVDAWLDSERSEW